MQQKLEDKELATFRDAVHGKTGDSGKPTTFKIAQKESSSAKSAAPGIYIILVVFKFFCLML